MHPDIHHGITCRLVAQRETQWSIANCQKENLAIWRRNGYI